METEIRDTRRATEEGSRSDTTVQKRKQKHKTKKRELELAMLNAGSKCLRSEFYVLCGGGNGCRPECRSRK